MFTTSKSMSLGRSTTTDLNFLERFNQTRLLARIANVTAQGAQARAS